MVNSHGYSITWIFLSKILTDDDDDEYITPHGEVSDSWVGTASEWREGRPFQTGGKQKVLQPLGEKTRVPMKKGPLDTPPTERRVVGMAAPSPS